MRIRGVGDSRGLPAITVDSGNELVMARAALRSLPGIDLTGSFFEDGVDEQCG
jgi:hypothetical protein